MEGATGDGAGWERFAAEIARIVEVPAGDVRAETRIIEDLGYDSLALAELTLVLIDDYDMGDVANSPVDRAWTGVTVGELYEEYGGGR